MAVAEELLNGPDVVALLQEVGRETVPQGVNRDPLLNAGLLGRRRGFGEVCP